MTDLPEGKVFRYDGRRLAPTDHRPVAELPIVLKVNGTELATLVASPHDLVFLVAGFLRLQGFIGRIDDILSLSVCPESGIAAVRIRGEVPDRLRPILTSGCGTGVTFNLPRAGNAAPGGVEGASRNGAGSASPPVEFAPDDVFRVMDALAGLADRYRDHGGIHSAAAGDGKTVLLSAEDIGRHNTIDRIAGEALLAETDLSGAILASSGRVSSEMAAKAAALGISVIASRTSPTDLAVRICEEAGITLIGYVRGRRFNVYSHPERIRAAEGMEKIREVTGVVLAGGSSTRMGSNKALLPCRGGRFIEAIHRQMADLFEEVVVVTNDPAQFDFLPCRKAADVIPGGGALSGIHAALLRCATPHIFVVACDMPDVNPDLVRHLVSRIEGHDAVIPESDRGLEPLHAVYGKSMLGALEDALRGGDRKLLSVLSKVRARTIARGEVSRIDPEYSSFRNINTPEDYYRLREGEKGPPEVVPGKPKARHT